MKKNIYLTTLIINCLLTVSCENCNLKLGSYGGGMLILKKSNSNIAGEINISQGTPAVKCYLTFVLNGDDNKCKKEIELIDSFGNKYSGIIKVMKGEVYIRALEQVGACQRVIDLKNGETFSLDK